MSAYITTLPRSLLRENYLTSVRDIQDDARIVVVPSRVELPENSTVLSHVRKESDDNDPEDEEQQQNQQEHEQKEQQQVTHTRQKKVPQPVFEVEKEEEDILEKDTTEEKKIESGDKTNVKKNISTEVIANEIVLSDAQNDIEIFIDDDTKPTIHPTPVTELPINLKGFNDWDTLKINDLRKLCKQNDLPAKGKRVELLSRLKKRQQIESIA